jgi:hypothetical protein
LLLPFQAMGQAGALIQIGLDLFTRFWAGFAIFLLLFWKLRLT